MTNRFSINNLYIGRWIVFVERNLLFIEWKVGVSFSEE